MAADTHESEGQWDENDTDALSVLQGDAASRANDAEQTARAFNALVELTDVIQRVVEGRVAIVGSDAFVEQLGRLNAIARDYYAMNPDSHA